MVSISGMPQVLRRRLKIRLIFSIHLEYKETGETSSKVGHVILVTSVSSAIVSDQRILTSHVGLDEISFNRLL